MKRKIALLLCTVMLILSCVGCAPNTSGTIPAKDSTTVVTARTEATAAVPDTITIVDHLGNEVILPAKINRIVVTDILPMSSILTVFLGSADKIVGMSPVSMSAAKSGLLGELFPKILDADTSFMSGSDVNIEKLMNLKPDVVFYNASTIKLGEKLRSSGIPAVAISVNKWDYNIIETYDQWISLLCQIFPERSEVSEKVSNYSKEIYNMIQERVGGIAEKDKKDILFLFTYSETSMITSGKLFFGQFWCEAVGGKNVAEEIAAENSNAVINMEQVYKWNPDIIFITNFTPTQPDDLYNNAIGGDDWSTVKAVQNKEVHKFPLGTYRGYTPSADTPVTLLWMAKKVYPELFEDINITEKVKDYYMTLYGVKLTDEQVESMYNPSREAAVGFSK